MRGMYLPTSHFKNVFDAIQGKANGNPKTVIVRVGFFVVTIHGGHGLAVPRAGYRSYVTSSIQGRSRLHLTYIPGVC